ncbi:MAG: prepilin-type N-terminal cleavage/methylation domain-containing protein [Planctomycetaceae bacterium]|nr:prepilin-type N-terminal cleavage/methylation domain-containing protein [Planctomycetales bacterium]MCB9927661.1 prepilin-type N-terminal cleavage/methylation domain-containing protein [Planctomycetaceae bacterium]
MMRRRDGVTLIELTVVLTILSLVWLSVTCVLYSLYRADQRLRDDLQRDHALDRLAMRLRLDAHAASSVSVNNVDDNISELVLTVDGTRSVHYSDFEGGVYRIVRQGEAVIHQDAFLTGRGKTEWQIETGQVGRLIDATLTVQVVPVGTRWTRNIKAAVARHIPVTEASQ